MKVTTPEISWHDREPIYSVDFQPGNHAIQRLASCGVDKLVRVWQLTSGTDGKVNFEFLSNLRRHTASVNVVRFSKNGEFLASAGDDCAILVWKLSDVASPSNNIFSEEEGEEDKETWVCYKTLRGHLGDVQDLSWSKDSRFLVSGSVDNSAIVWDVKKAQKIAFFNDHKSYVQGVAFDPLGDFIATLSSDRSMRIYSLSSKNCVHNVSKMAPVILEEQNLQPDSKPKSFRIFHDDGLRSFFRRLEFSTDGHLLFAPAGCVEVGEKVLNSSFIFVRGAFARPALYLPSGEKATIVVRANPQLFELRRPKDLDPDSIPEDTPEWQSHKSLFSLPYRIVFAVATDDSVLVYDSQQTMPIVLMKNIHYHQISDLSWTPDGKSLVISSTDGFCTICVFDDDELGVPYLGTSQRQAGSQRNNSHIKPSSVQDENNLLLSGNEDSPNKTTELPFTRYTDEDGNKKKEINTSLNIRRVKSDRASCDVSSEICKEKKVSEKVNTFLNIRKVKKEQPVSMKEEPVSKKEEKVSMEDESISKKEEPVSMEDEAISKEEPVSKKEEPVSMEEESVSKKEEPVSTNGETVKLVSDSVSSLPADVERMEIEEDKEVSSKEGTSAGLEESSQAGETVTKPEELDTKHHDQDSQPSSSDGKKRIQLTTLSLLK